MKQTGPMKTGPMKTKPTKTPEPEIVYEDNHVLVAIKPANMPSQGDPSGDMDMLTYLKEMIAARDHKPGSAYVGLVHRLDRPVGGLMVFAKTSKAAARLSAQIRAREMGKVYLAVVSGVAPESGTLRDYLLKDGRTNTTRVVGAVDMDKGNASANGNVNANRNASANENAKEAELTYRRIGLFEGSAAFSLLEVTIITGRSHQIRAQMAEAGHPLFGDAKYGHGKPGQQIALFASELRFEHPTQRRVMEFKARPPMAMPWTWFGLAE